MECQIHEFRNGIRLVHKNVPSMVAHFGFIVHTGSRDEEQNEHGIAHFIEHVMFKGTSKRKAFHIISRLEDVGGEINAYTTKEETCIHASFLKQDYGRAIELLSDIIFHSTFPEKEIERERRVILDEIQSYNDSPSELIFDDFEEQVYAGFPIGRNILGSEENLEKIGRPEIIDFIDKNYATDSMVLSSVGNIDFRKLVSLCDRHFGKEPAKSRRHQRIKPGTYKPEFKTIVKDTYQVHCIAGNLAYDIMDERRTGMHLLSNILGGPGMKSRLNMSLRERKGYSYNVESHYTPYTDTGIFMVYFGCDKENFNKSLRVIFTEFENMRKNLLGSLQMGMARKQLIGQIAISNELNEHLMLAMGKSILLFNRVDSLEEISRKIEAVTPNALRDIAAGILDKKELSILKFT